MRPKIPPFPVGEPFRFLFYQAIQCKLIYLVPPPPPFIVRPYRKITISISTVVSAVIKSWPKRRHTPCILRLRSASSGVRISRSPSPQCTQRWIKAKKSKLYNNQNYPNKRKQNGGREKKIFTQTCTGGHSVTRQASSRQAVCKRPSFHH